VASGRRVGSVGAKSCHCACCTDGRLSFAVLLLFIVYFLFIAYCIVHT
jgi:hypothetical protein